MIAMSVAFVSCNPDDDPVVPQEQSLGRYEFSLRSSQDSLSVSLLGITEQITNVVSPMEWLSIAQDGTDDLGNTRLSIVRLGETPSRFEADSAYVYFAENRKVTIVITADEAIVPLGDNASDYENFNKAWWQEEEILYSTTKTVRGEIVTTSEHIPLPWAMASTSNIPTKLFVNDGMTANEGWAMAYNLFAAQTNGNPNSKPYFMLYNKYTGVLRVFYYQFEDAGTGGEFSFVVTPDDASTAKYPFYSSLQYAIPVGNKDVQLKGNVLKATLGNNTFQQQVTPYVKADVVLKTGWYCFDLDWSAYNPAITSLFNAKDRMSIDCKTANNTNITMAGTITGESIGTIDQLANSSTSTSNGINNLDQFNSGVKNGVEAFENFMEGNYLKAVFKGGLTLWNFGKSLTGNATDDYETETKSTGNINQSFTGKISLDGYSTSNTSNNAIGVEFSYNAFSQYAQTGQGVWSLQDNPIVYVVNDRLLGEDEDFGCIVKAEGYSKGVSNAEADNLRLMTFFDPTSIKINLNTALYKDIRNVEMSWTYGVYPNQPHGHTDPYRKGIMDFEAKGMIQEPIFIDKKGNEGEFYVSFSSEFTGINMLYLEAPVEEMVTTSLDTTTTANIYKQAGANYRYYAHPGNELDSDDKSFFLVDPIVFLPATYDEEKEEGMIYDFVAPDFVVGVVLSFDYTTEDNQEATALFSKRFLPQVKSISSEEMPTKRDALKKYVDSGEHQTVNGVVIKHQGAKDMLKQFFATSEFIENYEYE